MLYKFLHFLMKHSIAAHYLEVKGIGINNIPKEGPLLVAATHPNSFLDAIIVAILMDRPLHFLARSDVFKAKWANNILRSMNLIPIYRLQEGSENLNRNEETFAECFKILDNGGAILIFAEGISLIDKKIRPLKKGLARIAFGFSEFNQFSKKCKIVPLSLNYDRPIDFRSKIIVGVGEPICLIDFKEIYSSNKNKGISELNKHVFHSMKVHTIEVEEEHNLVYKTITELDSGFTENSLARKIMIANQIKKASKDYQDEFQQLKQQSIEAFKTLKSFNLNFRKLKVNTGVSPNYLMFLLIFAPIALVILLLNGLPFLLAKRIADNKVKIVEFYASVRLVSGTILWLAWGSIITIIGLLFSPFFIFTIPILYYLLQFYLRYYEKAKYLKSSLQLRKLKSNATLYNELQTEIKNIYRLRKLMNLTKKES